MAEAPDIDVTPGVRDYFMARVAAARAAAQGIVESCDEIIALCIDPDEDRKGRDRKESLEEALDAAGAVSRALECADAALDADGFDPLECEPWDEDGDEEDAEPVIEVPRATARKRRS